MGAMSESEGTRDRRERFLQVAYDLSIDQPVPLVNIKDMAREFGEDPATVRSDTSEVMRMAQYWGNRGFIKSEGGGYGHFRLTSRGIDKVEGEEPTQQPPSVTNVNISGGTFQGSVVGANNTAELVNNFDLRSVEIEKQIEERGGADKEELREALEEVRRIIASENSIERGMLSRFSAVMERNSWFTGAIAQAFAGFVTQAITS